MRLILLLAALAAFLGACGSSNCGEVCGKAQKCSALPGPLGTDLNNCAERCRAAVAREQAATRACIDGATCADIQGGRCASW